MRRQIDRTSASISPTFAAAIGVLGARLVGEFEQTAYATLPPSAIERTRRQPAIRAVAGNHGRAASTAVRHLHDFVGVTNLRQQGHQGLHGIVAMAEERHVDGVQIVQ